MEAGATRVCHLARPDAAVGDVPSNAHRVAPEADACPPLPSNHLCSGLRSA